MKDCSFVFGWLGSYHARATLRYKRRGRRKGQHGLEMRVCADVVGLEAKGAKRRGMLPLCRRLVVESTHVVYSSLVW